MPDPTQGALTPDSASVLKAAQQSNPSAIQTTTPQIDQPGSITPAPDANAGQPATQNPSGNWTGGSRLPVLGPIERWAVNAGGRPQDSFNVDATTGQLTQAATQATPGTFFKNMLIGALTGLSAGAQSRKPGFASAMGAGFAGEVAQNQENTDSAREQAVQQFQMKQAAQRAQDEHTGAVQENQLRGAQIAYSNAQTAQLAFNASKWQEDQQQNLFNQQQSARDYMLKNGGTVAKEDVTWQQAQRLMNSDPSLTHSLHAYMTGQTPVLGQDGKEVMEPAKDASGNPILDANTKQPIMRPKMQYTFDLIQTPEDHVLTKEDVSRYKELPGFDTNTVKPGQTIAGSRWFNLENQYQAHQLSDLNQKRIQAEITAAKATAHAENERAQSLAQTIGTQKEQQQMKDDWGVALEKNDNDPQRASAWMRSQNTGTFQKSYQMLSAAESEDLASDPYIKTSDGTLQMKTRLFSSPFGQPKIISTPAAPPPGAKVYTGADGKSYWSSDGGHTMTLMPTQSGGPSGVALNSAGKAAVNGLEAAGNALSEYGPLVNVP